MTRRIRTRMCSLLWLTGLALCSGPVEAGEYQSWVGAIGQLRSSRSPWVAWFDAHARRFSSASGVLVRPGLGYRLGGKWTAYAGYAWTPVFPDAGSSRQEHRLWQQLIGGGLLAPRVRWAVRPRLEQRFLRDSEGTAHRLRVFVRASHQPKGGRPWLVAWDEIFFGLNDVPWGPSAGFDQNRLFLGLGFPSGAGPRFEVGYLNVNLQRTVSDTNHALAVNAFF